MNLPIVVAAYNRPDSLATLLNSLRDSQYPERVEIELIISIDFSGNSQCSKLANDFEWNHGKKRVICHNEKLGLRSHIITCGDLALNYDGIILLEDDVIVSPVFYYYALAASEFYSKSGNIAGISLYRYERNEFCDLPFFPVRDGNDTFFMKVPCSWGQIFLRNHWIGFKNSFIKGIELLNDDFLPDQVFFWPETSWKKLYFKYMIENDITFVYPMDSYSSNMGDEGTHCLSKMNFIRTNLTLKKENFRFANINETINIYDQFMEWDPVSVKINEEIARNWKDIEIDLFGYKPLSKIRKSKIVTSRKVIRQLGQISLDIHPFQLNLFYNTRTDSPGSFAFSIAGIKDVLDESTVIREYLASCICPALLEQSFNKGVQATKNSKRYKLGYFLLAPVQIFRKLFVK